MTTFAIGFACGCLFLFVCGMADRRRMRHEIDVCHRIVKDILKRGQ